MIGQYQCSCALEAGVEAGVKLERSYASVVHESLQLAPETHRIYPRHTHEFTCLTVVSGLQCSMNILCEAQ